MTAPTLPSLLASQWELAWSLDVQAAVVAGLYLWGVRRSRVRWPRHRTLAFLSGIGCVLVALQSGVDTNDDQLLSAHMVQHMLLLSVAPLLLVLGQPTMLALGALRGGARARLGRWLVRSGPLARPVLCIVVFDVVVLGTHLPAFYDATLRYPPLHDAEHVLYLLAGSLLYWPLVGADPAVSRRLGGLGRLIYMLAAMPAMALVGASLNRDPSLFYHAYGPAGRALGISALNDQAQAGAIMWVAGSVVMTVVGIWAALAGLAAEERRQQLADARRSDGGALGSSSPQPRASS